MSDSLMHDAALRFYTQHQSEHLTPDRRKVIDRCRVHLSETFNVSLATSEDVALRAWGEVESKREPCYFDLDRSTAHTLFLIDAETGERRVFSVAYLAGLIRTPRICSLPIPSQPKPRPLATTR